MVTAITIYGAISVAAYAERIRHSVDVIEPCGDQRDLQNSTVVKANGSQLRMIFRAAFRGIFGELYDVIEHGAVLLADRRGLIIFSQRFDHRFIQRDPAQKLCV